MVSVKYELLSKVSSLMHAVNKKIEGSTEDLSGSSAEGRTKIKAKLKRFFQRRPTMDALVKNGIYKGITLYYVFPRSWCLSITISPFALERMQVREHFRERIVSGVNEKHDYSKKRKYCIFLSDEPAFGSYLTDVCSRQPPMVPQFVKDCVKILERNPENMKADGLYRASGNLSQIQKIRLQVDQNNLDILEQEEDVHVLTGALKLFFRELKQPLIPSEFFEKALKGSSKRNNSQHL